MYWPDRSFQIIPVITEDGQPSAGGTYHWSASSLSSYTASNPTWDPTSNQLLNTQGNKSIMLQYWTSNGCESIEYYDFFYNKMEVTLSATAYTCNGNNNPSATITANVTGGNPNYTYYWSSSINPTSVVGGSQITVDDQGTNTYYVSVFDDNFNCTAQDEITLPAPTPIAFDISNVTIPDAPCALPSITNNTNMIQFNSPTGGTAPYEHSRDGGNT